MGIIAATDVVEIDNLFQPLDHAVVHVGRGADQLAQARCQHCAFGFVLMRAEISAKILAQVHLVFDIDQILLHRCCLMRISHDSRSFWHSGRVTRFIQPF